MPWHNITGRKEKRKDRITRNFLEILPRFCREEECRVKMYANDTEKFSSSLSIDSKGVRNSEIAHRGGHVKAKKSERAAQLRNEIPELPGFPGKTGIYRSHLGKGEAANRVPRCDLSWFFPREKGGEGEKEEEEEERRTGRRREFLAWWVLSIHDRRAPCLFHGLTRVTKRHSFQKDRGIRHWLPANRVFLFSCSRIFDIRLQITFSGATNRFRCCSPNRCVSKGGFVFSFDKLATKIISNASVTLGPVNSRISMDSPRIYVVQGLSYSLVQSFCNSN